MRLKAHTFQDGTSQRDRHLLALTSDYVAVDERSVGDWLAFVQKFAGNLQYYNLLNQPEENWSSFFDWSGDNGRIDLPTILAYLDHPENFTEDDLALQQLTQPHLVLLLTFLQLLRYPQQQFRALTQRRLEFYYRKVLRLVEQSETPNRVHVIFALAHRKTAHLIPKGTLLNAGKDSQGKALHYVTDADIVVNAAQLASVKTVSVQTIKNQPNASERSLDTREIQAVYATSIVDAKPGAAAEVTRFQTFQGRNNARTEEDHTTIQPLGFAIASPILDLTEGDRTITLTLSLLPNSLTPAAIAQLKQEIPFEIWLSSEAGWLQLNAKNVKTTPEQNPEPSPLPPTFSLEFPQSLSQSPFHLKFVLTLDAAQPPLAPPPQSEPVALATPYPAIKVLLGSPSSDQKQTDHTRLYQAMKSIRLETVSLNVTVKGLQALHLRNDASVLNPQSPFEPFGSTPRVGSSFYFAHPETSHKRLDSLSVHLEWMGLPQSFETHYDAYDLQPNATVSPNSEKITNASFKSQLQLRHQRQWVNIGEVVPLFQTINDKTETKTVYSQRNLAFTNFSRLSGYGNLRSPANLETDDPFEYERYFRLELGSPDFGHNRYPVVLNQVALAVSQVALGRKDAELESISALIVYPPYTPQIKVMMLDYTSSVTLRLDPKSAE